MKKKDLTQFLLLQFFGGTINEMKNYKPMQNFLHDLEYGFEILQDGIECTTMEGDDIVILHIGYVFN